MQERENPHLRTRACEIKDDRPIFRVDVQFQAQLGPIVQPIDSLQALPAKLLVDMFQEIAYRSFGSEHDGVHVEIDDFKGLLVDEGVDEDDTAVASSDLGV